MENSNNNEDSEQLYERGNENETNNQTTNICKTKHIKHYCVVCIFITVRQQIKNIQNQ